jgi:hypothetical protein
MFSKRTVQFMDRAGCLIFDQSLGPESKELQGITEVPQQIFGKLLAGSNHLAILKVLSLPLPRLLLLNIFGWQGLRKTTQSTGAQDLSSFLTCRFLRPITNQAK